MAEVFISYVEEDGTLARELAAELKSLGHSTWIYEEDGVPGLSYLTQVFDALSACSVFVLIASRESIKAHQVVKEVEQAHELRKRIVPVRLGITHPEFTAADPVLRVACGTAVSLFTNGSNPGEVARRIQTTIRAGARGEPAGALNTPPISAAPSVPQPPKESAQPAVLLREASKPAPPEAATVTPRNQGDADQTVPANAPERVRRGGSLLLTAVGVFLLIFMGGAILSEIGPLLGHPVAMVTYAALGLLADLAGLVVALWTVMAMTGTRRWRPRRVWLNRLIKCVWVCSAIALATLALGPSDSRGDIVGGAFWTAIAVAAAAYFVWRGLSLGGREA